MIAYTLRSLIIVNQTPLIYTCANTKLSLEHIYPKSLMFKKHYNDLHNIFKSDLYINNMKSNYKYTGELTPSFNRLYDSENFVNTKDKLFIPDDNSKGIIARAIMYMSFQYKYDYKKVIDYDNLVGWCLEFPPTKEEIHHNNIIFQKQKTRNMFIDMYHKKKFKNLLYHYFS